MQGDSETIDGGVLPAGMAGLKRPEKEQTEDVRINIAVEVTFQFI